MSRNDFVVQMISSVTGKVIHRAQNSEMASFGVAFMAGLDAGKDDGFLTHVQWGIVVLQHFGNIGIWKSVAEMDSLRQTDKTFGPDKDLTYLRELQR